QALYQLLKGRRVGVALDGWTNTLHDKVNNYVIQSGKDVIFWRSMPSHHAANDTAFIASQIAEIVADLRAHGIYTTGIVSDNASVMLSAATEAQIRFPHLLRVPCAAHAINLGVQDLYTPSKAHLKREKEAGRILLPNPFGEAEEEEEDVEESHSDSDEDSDVYMREGEEEEGEGEEDDEGDVDTDPSVADIITGPPLLTLTDMSGDCPDVKPAFDPYLRRAFDKTKAAIKYLSKDDVLRTLFLVQSQNGRDERRPEKMVKTRWNTADNAMRVLEELRPDIDELPNCPLTARDWECIRVCRLVFE
ncbi:hypothetical protein KIPB_012879, partial [Kipferlia bialata]